jgi:uncharacterized phage protein (TIGR01671 family)
MSRIIKFRAWHSDFGEMVYSSPIWEYGKREFTPFLFAVGFSHYPQVEWEIMQFTGLTDKNGKDIYEGDILKGKFSTGIGLKSTKYKEFVFSISHHITTYASGFNIDIPPNYGKYRFFPSVTECEVIGNIYQNPELLNQNSTTKKPTQ